MILISLTAGHASPHARADDRPSALLNAANYRRQFQTGEVEWSYWEPSRIMPGSPRGYFQRKLTRFTESEVSVTDRGDEEGITTRIEDGAPTPDPEGAARPRHYLRLNKHEYWIYQEHDLRSDLYGNAAGAAPDPRCFGLATNLAGRADVDELLWRSPDAQSSPCRYEERAEGDHIIVSAHADNGTTTWWIDPQRGWSPTRVTFQDQQGQVLVESKSTLKQFGDIWFPDSIAFYRNSYKDGAEPAEVVKIETASFNSPDHPRRLTPNDIGLQPGVMVVFRPDSQDPGKSELMRYDGQKAIPEKQFWERVRAGAIDLGPGVLREMHRVRARADSLADAARNTNAPTPPSTLLDRLSAWERYVRDFIRAYHLDDGQCARALTILRDCQQKAHEYAKQHASQFDQHDQKLRRLATDANIPHASETRQNLDEARQKLMLPVQEIFDTRLKPRLDKLLTRTQRAIDVKIDEPARLTDKP